MLRVNLYMNVSDVLLILVLSTTTALCGGECVNSKQFYVYQSLLTYLHLPPIHSCLPGVIADTLTFPPFQLQ